MFSSKNVLFQVFFLVFFQEKKRKNGAFTLRLTGNHKKMLTDISEVSFCDGHDDGVSYACGSQSSCAFFSFRKAYCISVKG
jgi:hypothetical protein